MPAFNGKVVIVTGSSSGIGQETLILFAKEGAKVVVHGQSKERLGKTVERLKRLGIRENDYLVVQGPIQVEATQRKLIDETLTKFGQLDVLVNNAGVSHRSDLQSNTKENIDFVFEVNCKAVISLTELALPHLEKTKGNVINVSTIGGRRMYPPLADYCAAKAALNHYTRGAAIANAAKGVRINTISPGFVFTEFVTRHSNDTKLNDAVYKDAAREVVPMKRSGDPVEIGNVIVFVASDKASYLTGVDLPVDGGVLATCGF